jgi:hypothetical protein
MCDWLNNLKNPKNPLKESENPEFMNYPETIQP